MASDESSSSSPAITATGVSTLRTPAEMIEDLDKFLHGDKIGVLKDVFQKIENDIQIRRINVALGFLACLALFLLFSDGARFVCDFIIFAYPACLVIWKIEQGHTQIDYRKWLTYYVIFNTLHTVEYFLLNLESFNVYWLWKFMVMMMCCLHQPENLYILLIKPFLEEYHVPINNFLASAAQSADNGVSIFSLLFCAYVWGFRSLLNGLGFLYPAYMSMVSLLGEAGMDRMYWLTFWVVYNSYNLVDYALGGLPLYYLVKFILLGIYMLEPQFQKDIYILIKKLILKHKPMSRVNRAITHFVQIFLTPHQPTNEVSRIYQIGGRSPGTSSLWNLPANRNKNTAVKDEGQQAAVDPLEVDIQMLSPLVKTVMELNVQVELIKKAITQKLAQEGPGQSFTSVESLLEAIFDLSACKDGNEEGSSVDELSYQIGMNDLLYIPHSFSRENYSQVPTEVIEENRQLKEQRLCKICMLKEVGMVFVPCGHLVCCHDCSFKLRICPICRAEIESSLRAYMS